MKWPSWGKKSLDQLMREKRLVSWDQRNCYKAPNIVRYKLNGIACPKCGNELHDDTSMILTSLPPQIIVRCLYEGCNFAGHRIP